jgi:methylisocitrate lyase
MIEGGRTPLLSYSELEELGFKIVVYPLTALFSATFSIQKAFAHLVKHGSTEGLDLPFDFEAFERVVDVPFLRDLDERFTKTRKS